MRVLLALLALLVSGCVAGGGPYVGYDGKFFVGAEGGAGSVVQGSMGLQTATSNAPAHLFIRGDLATFDPDNGNPVDVRGGAGIAIDRKHSSATFLLSANVNHFVKDAPNCVGRESGPNDQVASAQLQVRYTRGWAIVLAARYETVWQASHFLGCD